MSSDCPPQLQLSIQPTTTSFKRSFEEFGFDLESPVGTRSVNAGESGTTHSTGNERHKRARSRTSLDSEANGSMASSAASEPNDGGNVAASAPTTTVEPPRLPTPVLPDVDMPSYPQEEDDDDGFPPRAVVALPPNHAIETNPANTFQLTLDRFNAFDREIEVLRQPEPNLSTASSSSSSSSASALVPPASPPVLPPLIIDPHRLSPEAIDFLPEQSPRNVPEVFPLSVSVSGVNISSSSALPDRSRESTSPPVRFRQNLDVALERLRSPSPLAPDFVFQNSPILGGDDDDIRRHLPPLSIERGPPTLPPIPPIANDLHDTNSEASERNEEPSRPHAVPLHPPTLPPIPSVSEGFPDTRNVWDNDNAVPQPSTVRASARRDDDPPFRPLSPEIPVGYIDFERDFGQWFYPTEDSMSTSSVSTSAATAGTERETFGHAAPVPASTAVPSSPQSPSSPIPAHVLRARQAVEERGMHLSRIAIADTVARRALRASAATSNPVRAGPSTYTGPARSNIQDEHGTLAHPTRFGSASRAPLHDNARPSFNLRHNNWEERRNSLELPALEERWNQFNDSLVNEIEDTEYRLRRRPRFLGDSAENPETHTSFASRPRSEPDTNANFDVDFSSLLRAERHSGPQSMEPSPPRSRTPDFVLTQSWVERLRLRRENRMAASDEESDDIGPSEALHRLFTRPNNEDNNTSTRHSPPSTSRPSTRPTRSAWPLADDASNGGGATTATSHDDDPDRALWRPGGNIRHAVNRGGRDRLTSGRGRTAAALPRPGASNSLVAETASETRRQADFEFIRRRARSPRPWDNPEEREDARNGMDVDEVQGVPQARRMAGLPRRHSPPRLRASTDDPPTQLARLEFEDFNLYPPSEAASSTPRGPVDPAASLSAQHSRVPNEHLVPNSRTGASASNSRGPVSPSAIFNLPRQHSMVPSPWELPDVSLPFGDLFATLGEGRSRLNHPQRNDTERSESAPSLPHPDLGGTFTGHRHYASLDRPPAISSDVATSAATQPTHATPSRSDDGATIAEARQRSLIERQRQYVRDSHYDLRRLEEAYARDVSQELRSLRTIMTGVPPQSSVQQNNTTTPFSRGGSPSTPTRQAPGASWTARHEPPRSGTYSSFLPGPFRNTLLHVERHGSRNGGATMPPVTPEMPAGRDQRSSTESPYTSRPLPTETFHHSHSTRDTSSNMFSWSRRAMHEPQRRGIGTWAEPEFRQLIEERDRDMELLRRRQQEIYELRTRQLRDRARYRDQASAGSRIQESYEMSRTMTVGERDADNHSTSGESGNRTQLRRRLDSVRLNAMAAGAGMRRTRFFSDYMRDEDLDLLSYENLLNLTELAGDVRSRATPADILEKMEKSTYKEWKTPDSEVRCPICLDDYEPDDPVQKLPNCSHWLHQECLGQWLKTANTCPVCRGSVSETRPLGGRRSARTRSVFSGSLRRHTHGQSGPPPPGDNPGVSRFNHPASYENPHRPTRRGTRLAQPEQQAASASADSAEASSNVPGTSVAANTNRGAGLAPSDSEDEHAGTENLPHFHRWW